MGRHHSVWFVEGSVARLLRPTHPFFGLFTREVGGVWSLESCCCYVHFLLGVSGELLAPSLFGYLGG